MSGLFVYGSPTKAIRLPKTLYNILACRSKESNWKTIHHLLHREIGLVAFYRFLYFHF